MFLRILYLNYENRAKNVYSNENYTYVHSRIYTFSYTYLGTKDVYELFIVF